eukprot:1076260-Amphidinium_carterae.1
MPYRLEQSQQTNKWLGNQFYSFCCCNGSPQHLRKANVHSTCSLRLSGTNSMPEKKQMHHYQTLQS